MRVIGRDITKLETIQAPFPRLRYDEAVAMLNQAHRDGLEITSSMATTLVRRTRLICRQFDRPVMVHRYPADVKAFYMEPDPHGRNLRSASMSWRRKATEKSLAAPSVWSYDLLKSRIDEHELPRSLPVVSGLAQVGGVPHGGFGMGIERAVAWICGLDHVRETIPFARTLNRLYP